MGAWDRLLASWKGLPRILQIIVGIQVACWLILLPLSEELVATILGTLGFSSERFFSGYVWQIVTYPFLHAPADFFGLIFDVLLIWVLGRTFARRWRPSHFLFFLAACAFMGALIGGLAAWAIPLRFSPVLMGMDGPVLGLFVAFHMIFGREYVRLMGLSNPIQAKWILYVVLGMDVLFFVTGSNRDFGIQIGGLLAGWFLVTGRWRPRKMVGWVKKKESQANWARKRRRFKVVDGGRGGPRHH